MKNNKPQKPLLYAFWLLTLFVMIMSVQLTLPQEEIKEVTYNEFLQMVENDEVTNVTINLRNSTFSFYDKENKPYTSSNPKTENFKEFLLLNDIEVKELADSNVTNIIASFIQILIYFALISFLFRKMMPKTEKEEAIEKVPNVTFDDIAGEKELKKDLQFVIEYLKNPKKYEEMGARMPKGIILYGPPGTGKTLTAKAIAGTAGVPFFSVSGSDFVEMYVGLGAKRVRDLYKKARQKAPCIVFVDEIDAVGGDRASKASHSENNQTVNALLNELDGFNGSEGVLTICATNMLENLDPALIRPGRFDKQLAVPMPEKEDRIEILKVHSKGKKLAEDVDFDTLASMTVGFSGAAIEAMLNEAAFLAVNKNKKAIDMEDIDDAFYKIVMKGDKKQNQNSRDKQELEIVAWHEGGHALATKLYTHDAVPKVTIIASTSGAGGVTFRNPKEMSLLSKQYIEGLIKVMYAGRAAERCFVGNDDLITTGASSDIKQASNLIKQYITLYGMDDEFGLINSSVFQSLDSPEMMKRASEISKRLYEEVKNDIESHKEVLKDIAENLLKNESIDEKTLDAILSQHGINTSKEDNKDET